MLYVDQERKLVSMFTHEPEECYCGTCGALLESDGFNPNCFECALWISDAPVPRSTPVGESDASSRVVDSPMNSCGSKGHLEVEYGDRLDVISPLERGARRLG
jgi:hypothetical protein